METQPQTLSEAWAKLDRAALEPTRQALLRGMTQVVDFARFFGVQCRRGAQFRDAMLGPTRDYEAEIGRRKKLLPKPCDRYVEVLTGEPMEVTSATVLTVALRAPRLNVLAVIGWSAFEKGFRKSVR